ALHQVDESCTDTVLDIYLLSRGAGERCLLASCCDILTDTKSRLRSLALWRKVLLRNATPSVFHQCRIGRVLRSSCNDRGRRLASSRGREPRPGRCASLALR